MDVTPSSGKAARSRIKKTLAEPLARSARKARARKSAAEAPATATSVDTRTPPPDELRGMIATEAYFIAAQRNFAPGGELDDWLEAERRVLARL